MKNWRIWKISNKIFYYAKTINEVTFEIIVSEGFKSAFINKNKTLNKHFSSAIFDKKPF